jgi:hypothetical protein
MAEEALLSVLAGYARHGFAPGKAPQRHPLAEALREGPHKLVYWPREGRAAVYHVDEDVAEIGDLRRIYPELTERLMKRLRSYAPMSAILARHEKPQGS